MSTNKRIIALSGSYRKGGTIDAVLEEILSAAREAGAETKKIYLMDLPIEFCRNCRDCTQAQKANRGECDIQDDMKTLLEELETADGLVLASPVNFGTVTAVMKRFVERLVCFAYWPWGMNAPKERNRKKTKRAVVVVSSAAPALMTRLMTKTAGLLKQAAGLLGARSVSNLFVGLAAQRQSTNISGRVRSRARRLGEALVKK